MKYLSFEERGKLAETIVELIGDYHISTKENNELEKEIIYQRLGVELLKLTESCKYLIKLRYNDPKEKDYLCADDINLCIYDTVIEIIKNIENNKFDPSTSNDPIAATIAYTKQYLKNRLLNQIKKESKKRANEFSYDIEINEEGNEIILDKIPDQRTGYDTERQVYIDSLFDEIIHILENISNLPKEKDFINYLFIQKILGNEYKKNEIANILGCSPSYVTKKEKELKKKILPELKKVLDQ